MAVRKQIQTILLYSRVILPEVQVLQPCRSGKHAQPKDQLYWLEDSHQLKGLMRLVILNITVSHSTVSHSGSPLRPDMQAYLTSPDAYTLNKEWKSPWSGPFHLLLQLYHLLG